MCTLYAYFLLTSTSTTTTYSLSLHDALPIYRRSSRSPSSRRPASLPRARRARGRRRAPAAFPGLPERLRRAGRGGARAARSEEHTSELQSPCNLVCRLLLEKKKI